MTDIMLNQSPVRARAPVPGQRQEAPGKGTEQHRVAVAIHSTDPLSRAGAVSQLRPHPLIDLIDEQPVRPGAVLVVLAGSWDDALLPRLRQTAPGKGVRAVLVVEAIKEAQLLQAIEYGVVSVLWRREATAARLVRAVFAAARGDGDLPADLLGQLIDQVGRLQRQDGRRPGSAGLTPREADVVRLVAEGLDTREIAARLSYSERTVKNVLHQLTSRLRLRNRAHAVAHALREGYI